jgi:hypothetical protein
MLSEILVRPFWEKLCTHLDRRFDANDYYRYFLKNDEKFVIRAKKTRNIIYRNKTSNIMDVSNFYKGNFLMDFMDKHGMKTKCGIKMLEKIPLYV